MRELFIYYRSRTDRSAEVAERVVEFQARLVAQHPALQARLLCRPEVSDGWQTWMETYSINAMHSPDHAEGMTTELQQAIEREAAVLRPCIDGERHTEVFVPCAW